MTSLIFSDKSGYNDEQGNQISQAYVDALNLFGTVGGYNGLGYLYASAQVPSWYYLKPFLEHTNAQKSQIMGKIYYPLEASIFACKSYQKTSFVPKTSSSQWKIGDW